MGLLSADQRLIDTIVSVIKPLMADIVRAILAEELAKFKVSTVVTNVVAEATTEAVETAIENDGTTIDAAKVEETGPAADYVVEPAKKKKK